MAGQSVEGVSTTTTTDTVVSDQPAKLRLRHIVSLGSLVLVAWFVPAVIDVVTGRGRENFAWNLVWWSLSFIGPSVVAFFGTYWIRGLLRDAIAVSLFTSYTIFQLSYLSLDAAPSSQTQVLLTFFQQSFLIVMGFYFTGTVAVEVAKQLRPGTPEVRGASVRPGEERGGM